MSAYWVNAAAGSDNAVGDQAHPWKTLQHAANISNPGDYIRTTGTFAAGFSLDPLDKVSMAYASISYPADGDAKAAATDLRSALQKIAQFIAASGSFTTAAVKKLL